MYHTPPLDLLRTARKQYTQKQRAEMPDVDARTVRIREGRETDPSSYLSDTIKQRSRLLVDDQNDHSNFRFIDLFAGIGGIRPGFEEYGGHCVFTCEWNKFSQKTYLANFPNHLNNYLQAILQK